MGKVSRVFIGSLLVLIAFACRVPQVIGAPAGASYLEGALSAGKPAGTGNTVEPVNIYQVLGRMALSLAVVIGLIFLFAYAAKKFISVAPLTKKNSLVQVLDVSYLSPKKMIYVVDIAGEILVLGSDANSINFLSKIEDAQAKKIILSYSAKASAKGRFSKALNGYLHAAKAQDGALPESRENSSPGAIQQCVKDLQAQIMKIRKISDDV
jgi:flagellar biosynthetic protein FliO